MLGSYLVGSLDKSLEKSFNDQLSESIASAALHNSNSEVRALAEQLKRKLDEKGAYMDALMEGEADKENLFADPAPNYADF